MRADGIAEPRTKLLDELCLVVCANVRGQDRAGTRVALERDVARFLPDENVTGRELPCALEDRIRRGNRVEGEERLECFEVDLTSRKRAKLGRELERAVGDAVVER